MPTAIAPSTPIRRSLLTVVVALAFVGVILAAVGSTSPVRAGTAHLVEIEGFAFQPATLTIQAGDTVTWTNLDDVDHTATSTAGAFDSGLLGQGESYTVTFTDPGTFDYLCTPHPTMTGRIVVEAAAPPPAASQPPAPGGSAIPDVAMASPARDLAVPAGIVLVAVAALLGAAATVAARSRQRAG
jgi:amicyanin